MSSPFFLRAALAGLLMTLAGGASANLIDNGSFDTDLSGWTEAPGTTTGVTWISGTAHVGRPGTPGVATLYQGFFVPLDAQKLIIGFDYEWQVEQPTLVDVFLAELILTDAGGAPSSQPLVMESSADAAFGATVSYTGEILLDSLSGSAPNAQIRFTLLENNAPVGTRIQLDNVEIHAVPVPATAALLGLGLLGLAGMARVRGLVVQDGI